MWVADAKRIGNNSLETIETTELRTGLIRVNFSYTEFLLQYFFSVLILITTTILFLVDVLPLNQCFLPILQELGKLAETTKLLTIAWWLRTIVSLDERVHSILFNWG